jgi:hypothetical protein
VVKAGQTLPSFANANRQSQGLMRKVLEEFRQRRVFHAQKYLEDILRQWGEAQSALSAGKAQLGEAVFIEAAGETGEIAAGEKAILDALRKPDDSGIFSDNDAGKMNALGKEERALSEDTMKLKRSLDEFMRQSALVDPAAFENMKQAAGAMNDAGEQLSRKNASGAADASRRALDYLREGGEGLEAAGNGMGVRGEKAGMPGSTIRLRSAGNGRTGYRSAPVRLPRADEYKVPRAFRQELLEGLKEKYPLQYDKIIKEYYRRLAQ